MKFSATLPRLFPRQTSALSCCASIICLFMFTLSPQARAGADDENRRDQPEAQRSRAQSATTPLTPDRRARYLHIAGDILEAGGFLRDSRELHARGEKLVATAPQPTRGRGGSEAETAERIDDLHRGVEAEMRELHEHVERSFGKLREQTERELIDVHKKTDAGLGELNERFGAEVGEIHEHLEAELGELHQRVEELHQLLAHIARDLEEDDDENEGDDEEEDEQREEKRERSAKKRKASGRNR